VGADFFVGGRVIDVILALVAVEAVALLAWRRSTGRGPAPLSFLANVLAGAFLLLALREALRGESGSWIAICLVGALLAHVADLKLRWDALRIPAPRAPRPPAMKATISLRVARTRPAPPRAPHDGPSGPL
jgi:hypothetical protein